MAPAHDILELARAEDAVTALFCLVDDAYYHLNPNGGRYGSLKRLSDSEVLTLALFQQLRGVESERSFLRDAERFFAHLFPGVVGLEAIFSDSDEYSDGQSRVPSTWETAISSGVQSRERAYS